MSDRPLLDCQPDPEEDLSSFIQLFKRTIITAQLLSLTVQKGTSACSALCTAWEIVEQLTGLAERQNRGRLAVADEMTFSRFLSRLIEIIANCKIKYQYTKVHPHDEPLERFLKELQAVVRSSREFQGRGSFGTITGLTRLALLKYCNKMLAGLSESCLYEDQGDENSMQAIGKIREQFIKARQIQKASAPRIFFLIASSDHERLSEVVSLQQRQSHTLPTSQTFSDVRKRFDRYTGMDLDFSFFRSSYFQAKSHYDSFYRDYLTRNNSSLSIIETYDQEFQYYAKRREAKSLRKDKIERATLNFHTRSMNVRNQAFHLPKQKITGISIPNNKAIIDRAPISLSLNSTKAKSRISKSKSRPKEPQQKDITQSDRNSKETFQSGYKYLASGFTDTKFDIDRENLHREPHKSLLRVCTQTDKRKTKKESALGSETRHENLLKQKMNRGFLTSMGKVSLKTKYFELNSLPEVLQEASMRTRMIFNHKFSIKHATRNKSRNWFEKKIER